MKSWSNGACSFDDDKFIPLYILLLLWDEEYCLFRNIIKNKKTNRKREANKKYDKKIKNKLKMLEKENDSCLRVK